MNLRHIKIRIDQNYLHSIFHRDVLITAYFGYQKKAYHQLKFRAINPPHLQILRIDREGMIDGAISHGT